MNSSCTSMPRGKPSPWNFGTMPIIKQELMETEDGNNDSGINSGSDFHSSSPGSDSQDVQHAYRLNLSTSQQSSPVAHNYSFHHQNPLVNSAPVNNMTPFSTVLHHSHHHPQNYSQPLTPPHSEPSLVSPKSEKEEKDVDATLTPCNSPREKPPLPPLENSNNSDKNENDISNDGDDFDDSMMMMARLPKTNSQGKVKRMKCKQCEFVAVTKEEFWKHAAIHIKPDKRLSCTQCCFITEYKHHLEYHLRNHVGSKPFKCGQCSYSCVNKSMLNSHMKSHSNVYQYHCSDCNYATKYCHSLKLHLRKYKHSPGRVLNVDGTVNPLPIIDVYGTRRGPKSKPPSALPVIDSSPKSVENNRLPLPPDGFPFGFNPFLGQPQFPFPYPFLNGLPQPNPELLRNFQQLVLQERMALAAAQTNQSNNNSNDEDDEEDATNNKSEDRTQEVLDLSKAEDGKSDDEQPRGNRRKGPAFKLDHLAVMNDDESDDENTHSDYSDDKKSTAEVTAAAKEESVSETNNNNEDAAHACQYCDITFGDAVLYSIHMGYHGFRNPYTCNMCGVECTDKVAFFLHIARVSHS